MKQPLAGVVALFAVGIVLGRYLEPPLALLFFFTLASGLCFLLVRRCAEYSFACFLVLSGWADLTWRTAVLSPDDLRELVSSDEVLVHVRGTLTDTPEYRVHERRSKLRTNTLAILECDSVRLGDRDWRGAYGRIVVSTSGALDERFRGGSGVTVQGLLKHPNGPAAPGLFDYGEYLRWRGIFFELRATPMDWEWAEQTPGKRNRFADQFQIWARRTLALGIPVEDRETQLLWAMVLGWKTGLTDEVEEPFMRSGTMHIFAISGLHIALIAAFVTQFLRLLQVPRLAVGLVVLVVVWFYTAATGWQPSAIRATIMTSVVVGGWALSRPVDVLNSLAVAGWVVLLWEPRQLFQAGFQLSFGVVAALGLLMPAMDALRRRLFAVDPFLPDNLVAPWRRKLRDAGWWVSGGFAVSLSSWLGSLPLTAIHFHLLTPGSLLANLIVVPLSSLALASSLASLACGLWAPSLSELFNNGAWLWMHLTLAVSEWSAAQTWTSWNVREPPWAATVLWYLILFSFSLGWWGVRSLRVLLLGTTAVLAGLGMYEWMVRARESRMVVLPLGGGHAVWLQTPDTLMLVDTGDELSAEFVTRGFLRAQGVNHLPWLLLTHGDVRHVGGASLIAEQFHPRNVVISPLRFRSTRYREAVSNLQARVRELSDGGTLDHGVILFPRRGDRVSRADDGALVWAGKLGQTRVLLLSDLSRTGQARLLGRHPDLRGDIVVAGLSDRGEVVDEGLLASLGTRLLIVADALQPASARVKPEAAHRLRRRYGIPVYFTSETGALDLRWADGEWRIEDAGGREVGRVEVPGEEGQAGIEGFRPE